MMVHNYYLYEEDGVLAMIPWDYNLAYGTMSNTNATSSVNEDIDTLVSMGGNDRPMATWITSSEEYMAQYRAVYQEFMTTVFDSGWFNEEYERVYAMISPYVEADPTAFCTWEQFEVGSETLRQFCIRRAQSVNNQLAGTNERVDASDLDISAMGTMNGTGGGGGGFGDFGSWGDAPSDAAAPAGETQTPAEDTAASTAPAADAAASSAPTGSLPMTIPPN